jgi:hypothetical protein
MSKRSDLLVACMLGNRWRATSAPAAGSTCVATSPIPGAQSKVHLESIWYSIKNLAAAGVTYTVQVQVRGASNTVLASVDHLVGVSASANVNISNLGFANPKLGTSLNVFMNTVFASVTQAVNVAGWVEDTNG